MGKFRTILLLIILTVVIVTSVFLFVAYFNPKGAGIIVDSSPASTVYIDGEQVGKTPYKETRSPGEVIVKLVPDSFDTPLSPYETKVNLVSGIETVVARNFGPTDDLSAGEVLAFEKTGDGTAGFSIVSVPDSAQITLDGVTKAFSPYRNSNLSEGAHTVVISIPGYLARKIDFKTYTNYKLTALVKLAVDPNFNDEPEVEPTPTPGEVTKPVIVTILPTPVGFLRVRSEASSLGAEVGQVKPGEKYELLEEDQETGWYKIEYEEGKEGWISDTYAQKDQEIMPTPTLSVSVTPKPEL